jgi:hypothetical protein
MPGHAIALRLVAGGLILLAPPEAVQPPDERAALVNGILTRADAVFSGRMRFHGYCCEEPYREDLPTTYVEASFMKPSWISRTASGCVYLSHNGKSVAYVLNVQRDGRRTATLTIGPPEEMNSSNSESIPCFAGTIWERSTVAYIKNHADEARVVERRKVNGVDTVLVEWVLSKKQSRSLGYNDINAEGGFLRVYVAPQLGFVTPRVELCGPGGAVADLTEASEFSETGAGIFMPKHCYHQVANSKGVTYYHAFRSISYEKINDVIPEADFMLEVGPDAMVVDVRQSGKGQGATVFRLAEQKVRLQESLQDVLRLVDPPSALGAPSHYWWVLPVMVGCGLGIAAVVAYYFVTRQRLA